MGECFSWSWWCPNHGEFRITLMSYCNVPSRKGGHSGDKLTETASYTGSLFCIGMEIV
jgi:hypothetical protein